MLVIGSSWTSKFKRGAMEFGCYCGSYRAELTEPPSTLINCHCGFCRRLSGAAFSTWATVAVGVVNLLKSGPLRHYHASDNATRTFCEICGTHVYSVDTRLVGKIGIPAGIIVGPHMPTLSGHYFVDDKATWHEIRDATPCFGGETGFQPLTGSQA